MKTNAALLSVLFWMTDFALCSGEQFELEQINYSVSWYQCCQLEKQKLTLVHKERLLKSAKFRAL